MEILTYINKKPPTFIKKWGGVKNLLYTRTLLI